MASSPRKRCKGVNKKLVSINAHRREQHYLSFSSPIINKIGSIVTQNFNNDNFQTTILCKENFLKPLSLY